jgi:peroxiredoxin
MRSPLKLIAVLAVLAIGALCATLAMPVRSAPEASFVTLSGERFTTSDLRGRVVVVNFWATSCGSCLAEMPNLERSYRRYAGQGYEFIAVAMRYDPPATVAEFTRRRALPFKVALDRDGEVAKRFGNVHVTPTTFVIDRQGRVLRRFIGPPDWKALDAVVEQALAART